MGRPEVPTECARDPQACGALAFFATIHGLTDEEARRLAEACQDHNLNEADVPGALCHVRRFEEPEALLGAEEAVDA